MNLALARLAAAIVCALAAAGALAAASAPATAAAPAVYKEARWEDLIPPGWDPLKQLPAGSGIAMFSDGSLKAMEYMRQLREVWDNAPTNGAMDGAALRLPGYVVPIEESAAGLREFLLVPYFGACIHSPPPPANQIVHVILDKPIKGVRSMDAVWASGTLATERGDSAMGASGYTMRAAVVAPYKEQRGR